MTTPATYTRVLPGPTERRLASTLSSMDADIAALYEGLRAVQLGKSTLAGTLVIRDPDGTLTGLIGQQPDGTAGVTIQNASPPPRPNTATMTPFPAGVYVEWNGTFPSGPRPANFNNVEVYLGASPTMVLGPSTFVGTLSEAGHLPVGPLSTATPVYAILIATNLAEDPANVGTGLRPSASEPSLVSAGVTPAQVVAQAVLDGVVNSVALADDAVSRAKIQADAVDGTKIADGSIQTPHMVASSIDANVLAAQTIYSGLIATDAIDARTIAALSVQADALQANSVQAGAISAGAVTAAKLETDLLLASRIAVGSLTGNRLEFHPTSGLQGFFGGTRTLWFDNSTGNLTAQGQWMTRASGTRIVVNPNNSSPDTIRFFPGSGSNYASIDSFDAGGGYAGILMYGSAASNDVTQTRGMVVARQNYCSMVNGRPDLSYWGSEIWVEPNFTRNKSAVVDLIIDGRLSDPSPRVAMVRWNSDGSVGNATILQYQPTQFNGGEPTWHATGQNSGFVFAPSKIYVRNNGNTAPNPINASAFEVNSSEAVKEDIAEINVPEQRTSWDIVEGAPAQGWYYTHEGKRDDKPRHLNGEPLMVRKPNPALTQVQLDALRDDDPKKWIEVEAEWEWDPVPRRRHAFPIAEDLAALDPDLVRDNPDGNLDVDLRDMVGVLWDAVDMLIKRTRVLETELGGRGAKLPPRPQRGDVRRGVGEVVPGRTKRVLDPDDGQVPGRRGESLPVRVAAALAASASAVPEPTVEPEAPMSGGQLFVRGGSLWFKNAAGQTRKVA